jgi:RNA polymerase sigma-70 factor (ECF subfamily)
MGGQLVDTDVLVDRAVKGDQAAAEELFARHRDRLRRMIVVRMDRRLAARLDPSDVVQETLAEAAQKLADYARERPLPFYPWLRRLAWERLVRLHRHHVRSQKRSVTREENLEMPLPDESVARLADRLVTDGTSPTARLVFREMLDRVQSALAQLTSSDRDTLVLRHLEQLSTAEAAEVLGVSPAAFKTRHFRAIRRLHRLLEESPGGPEK